jgi:hypothetical protein
MPPPKEFPVRIATAGDSELWAVGKDEKGLYLVNVRDSPNSPDAHWRFEKPILGALFGKWADLEDWDFDPQYL